MKMNKILAVLLSVAMLAAMIPAFSLGVSAAVGSITNGGFDTGDFTGWDYYEWSTSISSTKQGGSYSAKIGKDSSLAGHVALEQVVPVNKNATYTFSYYTKRNSGYSGNASYNVTIQLGDTPTSFTSTVVNASQPSFSWSGWKQVTHSISTTSYKYMRIRFNALGSGTDSLVDTVAITINNAGDASTHAAPSFIDFGSLYNRPKTAANNVIAQPSFESTSGAAWNTSNFIKTNLSVENSTDAVDGSKVLHYKNTTTTESWHTFNVSLPGEGNYVLSAWVKTPFLSATNQGKASFGLIDPATGKFFTSPLANYKGHTSTPWQQIRSTATDNQWHLRSITFYVGAAVDITLAVYGKQSEMYIDDISVHLLANGTPYIGDQTGTLSATSNSSNLYCESEDNLIADCNMTSTIAENFWKQAGGWNNGFMNWNKTAERLEFNGTGASGLKVYNYVKWISVEPNTKYTVSFDYRVMSAGTGALKFIDNNVDLPEIFNTVNFSSATNDWTTKSFTFNTGNYNRIGIVFTDGTAKAYFDDFRFFKTSDGIAEEPEEELYPSLKPTYQGKSRSEGDDPRIGQALGFLFKLDAKDVKAPDLISKGHYTADYSNATVAAFQDNSYYKLLRVGAVMTRDESIGQSEDLLVLESVDSNKTIDIEAKKVYNVPTATSMTYGVRLTNIPTAFAETVIYTRPYYIFEYNGRQVTVYGDIQHDSYIPQKDINDGWLEWN